MFESERHWRRLGALHTREALIDRVGPGLCVGTSPHADGKPLFEGLFAQIQLRPGLFAQLSDIVHTAQATTRFEPLPPGTKIIVKLEGDALVRMDGKALPLDAGEGTAAKPTALMLSLAAPTRFEREARCGTRERMLVLTLLPAWLEASGLAALQDDRHLRWRAWRPSERIVGRVEHLLRLDAFDEPAARLRMESAALEIVAEALAASGVVAREATAECQGLSQFQRACRVRALLDSGADGPALSVAALARRVACNAATLQAEFRKAFGLSIAEYARDARLRRAARAIQIDNQPIGRAAELAGYSSQANFSTAFRKHFGFSPKRLKPRV